MFKRCTFQPSLLDLLSEVPLSIIWNEDSDNVSYKPVKQQSAIPKGLHSNPTSGLTKA